MVPANSPKFSFYRLRLLAFAGQAAENQESMLRLAALVRKDLEDRS